MTVEVVERPFIALRFARRRQRVQEAFSHPTDDSLEFAVSESPFQSVLADVAE
jgi:hypothetical protein